MSKSDAPAGGTGGSATVPAGVDLDELPDRIRVHALAKLIGRTSRELLATLADLGVEAKSAQSSVDRKAAEQAIVALVPAAEPAEQPEPEPAPPAAASMAPVFAPPTPLFQAPEPVSRRRRAAQEPAADETASEEPEAGDEPAAPVGRRRTRARRAAEPVEEPAADESDDDTAEDGTDESADESEDGGARRRRRRGRRGRGRGRGGDEAADESSDGEDADQESDEAADTDDSDSDAESDSDDGDDTDEQAEGTSRRRRRRRRRRGAADEVSDDDPPGTVTKVRAPREDRDEGDGVQSVRGSTRLEAKRQRRRDGRDAGRRRAPILSEAEFLARRESVDRTMVVREHGERVEIAVLEDDVLVEHFVAGAGRDGKSLVGNVYLGRVQNVLPSMEAAFVDIGRGRNAVLYAGEVDWDAAGLNGKARRIEQALQSGDSVLVQVTKDPVGHKGARLTTQISLAGRFLVYVPSGGAAGISRKLPDVERKRLKDMLKEIVPSEAGVIIRTASEGVSHEALERDVRRLQAQWEVVKAKAEATGPNKPKAPVLLYEEPDLIVKVVRDQFNEDFTSLIVEGDDAWDTVSGYISHVAPELVERLHRHTGPSDVFAAHRIDEQLLKALDRKVWLPSGGTLVIDRTEAMTVIDVNTGKFTGSGGNLEETVTRNNLEAAEEIVRQLRLRDIGGIIVVDFIDMVLEANRDLVLRRLTECLARDRTRHQVAEVTSLGLVQMTRKRVGGGLLEHFSTPCEHCRGRGIIVSTELPAEKPQPGDADRGGRRRGGRGRRGDEGGTGGGNGSTNGSSGGNGSGTGSTNGSTGGGGQRSDQGGRVERPAADTPVAEKPVPETVAAEQPSVEAAVVTESVAEKPVAPKPEPAPVAAEPVARNGHGVAAAEVEPTPEPVNGTHPAEEAPRPRRRGRVTRTAGAPTTTSGEAPAVGVVTVPAEAAPAAAAPPVPAQPEPTVTSRPRRARRAASRPAGPPVGEE
ncbi:translation initiation factor IF-2 N-terminal domain-containing protein [Pseudonocardia sp. CA-107938]|uniref:translation initiation factor IF-2 N-terminal domain-containing protein n=1 Tax=Pseudonocardia sp. CA-107938 TaxID=3240021 RepID=UPI003D8FC5BD